MAVVDGAAAVVAAAEGLPLLLRGVNDKRACIRPSKHPDTPKDTYGRERPKYALSDVHPPRAFMGLPFINTR